MKIHIFRALASSSGDFRRNLGTYDEAAENELRKRMGLPRRRKTKEEKAVPEETNKEQKTTKKRASSVGHRRPSHDPVKGGAQTDEQACAPAV